MLSENELRGRSVTAVTAAVQDTLRGEYEITSGDVTNDWAPILKRHVFVSPCVVWRNFDRVRIAVSVAGEVVAFFDQNRFQDAAYQRLADSAILDICRVAGIVGPSATVTDVQPGPSGTLLAILSERFPRAFRFTRATVNPSTRQLAAFEVQL
jgi:hypothetical protein